ncbi:MAG: antibiotic biosynthesis monooxygenase [Pseudonocardiales bacterium]|nr:antibiotic biosynthesis monooxygenase [Pseudonocardiales bacterium]
MSVTVFLELTAKPGLSAELATFLAEMLPVTRSAQGCEELVVVRSHRDDHTFAVVQTWRSRELYLAYSKWRRDRGDLAPFSRLLDGSPRLDYYDILATY